MIPALPPFANENFDVIVFPPVVALPEGNGSVTLHVDLKATNLTHDETLVLETQSSIPGYSAYFNSNPVILSPGQSISLELTVTIPSGVQDGTYPISIIAKGATTEGGGWAVIIIGPSATLPPPP
jgi:hypothetical protein